jgi:hypothetical protein
MEPIRRCSVPNRCALTRLGTCDGVVLAAWASLFWALGEDSEEENLTAALVQGSSDTY